MSMGRVSSNGVEERIGQLCSEFKLPTVGAEAGPRFTAAGHMDALHTLVEVLEQEAEDRRQRRIIRIRRASRLPVGKTWDTFEHDRVPVALRHVHGLNPNVSLGPMNGSILLRWAYTYRIANFSVGSSDIRSPVWWA